VKELRSDAARLGRDRTAFGYIDFLFSSQLRRPPLADAARLRQRIDLSAVAGDLLHLLDVFRSVGSATCTSFDFLAIYVGPIPMITVARRRCAASSSWQNRSTSPRSPTSSPRATARARRSPPPWR
jgi:hypothetical protein